MHGLGLGGLLQLLLAACLLHQLTGIRESENVGAEAGLKSVNQRGGRQPLNVFYDGNPKLTAPGINFPKKAECMIVQRGDTWDLQIPGEDIPSGGWNVQSLLHTAVSGSDEHSDWLSQLGPTTFSLTVPRAAAVGEYQLTLGEDKQFGLIEQKEVCLIVLFNAACSQCEEFVDSEIGREEFVGQTTGLIWRGAALSNRGYYWEYDQFRFVNLRVAIDLLNGMSEDEGLTELQHASAVEVVRELSYTINEHVCTGKWDGAYAEGIGYDCNKAWPEQCTKPTDWFSSTNIIEQHWALRHKEGNEEYAVQYCQCWVFAGLMTTLGRALGLPIRPVTNFESAHDSNNDRAISKFYWKDPEGNMAGLHGRDACPQWCDDGMEKKEVVGQCDFDNEICMDEIRRGISFSENCTTCARCIPCASGGDSKWNFHVWNEVFLKREEVVTADGARGNVSGWQAVDATPQEESHGRMQMGPAPLTLVSEAAEGCYDSKFVAAEVNADFKVYVLTGIQQESEAYEGKGTFEMDAGSNLYLNRRWVNDPFAGSANHRTKGVGERVLTKKPGRLPLHCQKVGACYDPSQSEDVTSFYKKPGSYIGVDPPDYVPLLCPRLDDDDEDSMEDESDESDATSQREQTDFTRGVNSVVLPVVEKPIEYSISKPGSNPSFAQVTNVGGKDSTTAGYIVEAQRLNDLGIIFGGDVRMDTAFLIRGVSRPWTQQELDSREPLLGVWPEEETVVSVSLQNLNMHEVRHVVLSITATPVDYRGRPVVYKVLRNRKVIAKVQFSKSGATSIKESDLLNPGGGVQTFSRNLPNWVFSADQLQTIGVDIVNCVAFDFVVSAKVTKAGTGHVAQMLLSEQRVHWAPPS